MGGIGTMRKTGGFLAAAGAGTTLGVVATTQDKALTPWDKLVEDVHKATNLDEQVAQGGKFVGGDLGYNGSKFTATMDEDFIRKTQNLRSDVELTQEHVDGALETLESQHTEFNFTKVGGPEVDNSVMEVDTLSVLENNDSLNLES